MGGGYVACFGAHRMLRRHGPRSTPPPWAHETWLSSLMIPAPPWWSGSPAQGHIGAAAGNIPGWVATVITQAVLLFGCCDLHFSWRLSSAGPQWGSAHSRIFGSGGEMRLRVDPPSSSHFQSPLLKPCRCGCLSPFCFRTTAPPFLSPFPIRSLLSPATPPDRSLPRRHPCTSFCLRAPAAASAPPRHLRLPTLPRTAPGIPHTFSAFWLRSSVVSVLISLISDISSTAG